MSSLPLTVELYVLLLFVLMLAALVYNHVARLEWNEADRRRIEAANLNLAAILRLLEAPDTGHLLRKRSTRLYVFGEYARSLRQDVLGLVRTRNLGPSTIGLVLAFFAAYYLLRLKALLACGRADLLFLGRLELIIVRSIA